MSETATQPTAQDAWIERVLGVAAPTGSATNAGAPPEWEPARARWQEAGETVNHQIAALQQKLRGSDDEELVAIAEYGLNGITGNHRARLTAQLMEIGDGNGGKLAERGAKLQKLVRDYRAYLEASPEVAVCDRNPFGVAVSIRATLGGALASLDDAVSKALA
jgi:hypothetical protein